MGRAVMGRREWMRAYQRAWAARRRAEAIAELGGKCVVCGATEHLEIDHIDPATKVSHHFHSWAAPRRAAELSKCQLLCQRHHTEKTNAQVAKPLRHGTTTGYRRGCRCDECRRAVNVSRASAEPGVHHCRACGATGHNRLTCKQARSA